MLGSLGLGKDYAAPDLEGFRGFHQPNLLRLADANAYSGKLAVGAIVLPGLGSALNGDHEPDNRGFWGGESLANFSRSDFDTFNVRLPLLVSAPLNVCVVAVQSFPRAYPFSTKMWPWPDINCWQLTIRFNSSGFAAENNFLTRELCSCGAGIQ